VLLFLALRLMTGAFWRSALVAALFGLHPLHVESVAWVSERKDVLSTLFFLLTLCAYTRYAQSSAGGQAGTGSSEPPGADGKPGRRWTWYWLAVTFLALGLMSKPMLVSMPFVLLL